MWYNDLCAEVQGRIDRLDWVPLVGDAVTVSGVSQAKTRQTLAEKLRREYPLQLPSINDLGCVRYDVGVTLSVQDAIAATIHDYFPSSAIKDLRAGENAGYRGVHVLVRHRGGNVEVQVLTRLQSAWANAYERAGDLFGREIRYGAVPEDDTISAFVKQLQSFSVGIIAASENARDKAMVDKLTIREEGGSRKDQRLPVFMAVRRATERLRILAKQQYIAQKNEDLIHGELVAIERQLAGFIVDSGGKDY